MSEEPTGAKTDGAEPTGTPADSGAQPAGQPAEPTTPSEPTGQPGGHPDAVYRASRKWQEWERVLGPTYDAEQLLAAAKQQSQQPSGDMGPLTAPPGQPSYQPQGDAQPLDEYEQRVAQHLSQQFGPVVQTVQQMQRQVNELENMRVSQALEAEATQAGLSDPTLRQAYVRERMADPDKDPLALQANYTGLADRLYQAKVAEAKQRQASPTPNMSAATPPTVNMPDLSKEDGHTAFEKMGEAIKEGFANRGEVGT